MSSRLSYFTQEVFRWEGVLFKGFFKGWHFFLFIAGIVVTLLVLYGSHSFIFTHPDFIILVLIPPLLTWIQWSKIFNLVKQEKGGVCVSYADLMMARLAILLFTVKLCIILMIIFRFMPTVFIAPYEFVSWDFWGHACFILFLHGLMFSVMNLLRVFHARPYLFFIFAYFPIAGLYFAMEQSLYSMIGWSNGLLLLLWAGCLWVSYRRERVQ